MCGNRLTSKWTEGLYSGGKRPCIMTSQYSLVEQFNIIIKGTVTDGRFPSSFALRTAIKPRASLRSCHSSVPHVLRLCLGCHQSLWPHGCSSLFRAPISSGFTPLLEEVKLNEKPTLDSWNVSDIPGCPQYQPQFWIGCRTHR